MKAPLVLIAGIGLVSLTLSAPAAEPPLPSTTLAKIAAMQSLFDGRTLEGWIQQPPAPLTFSGGDIVDLTSLAKKMMEKPDAISAYVSEQLDDAARTALTTYLSDTAVAANGKALNSALLKNINRLVSGPTIFDEARFHGVRPRHETTALRARNPQGVDLMRLNRVLLEDAFPTEFLQSPVTSWIVKDRAMSSTGGGRGVIYTKQDFIHYRLIFSMRHVSGKPDHQPCILIFCTRPPEGERGLDALGGIQFQTPNGGHWDYRPGHNNGGTAFSNPVKTKLDNHEWHQVEILVDARNGTARMAVAQPVGSRAIENLVFNDPAAGKTGPIAWQMHNAGLFDEFKDVRIEIDPAEDRLITTE